MITNLIQIFTIIVLVITIPIIITRIFYPSFFTQPLSDNVIEAIQKSMEDNELDDLTGYIIEYDKNENKAFLVKDNEYSDIDVLTPLMFKSSIIGIITSILGLCIELLPILLRIVGIINTPFLIIYYIVFIGTYFITVIFPTKLGYNISDLSKSILLLVLLFTKLL